MRGCEIEQKKQKEMMMDLHDSEAHVIAGDQDCRGFYSLMHWTWYDRPNYDCPLEILNTEPFMVHAYGITADIWQVGGGELYQVSVGFIDMTAIISSTNARKIMFECLLILWSCVVLHRVNVPNSSQKLEGETLG